MTFHLLINPQLNHRYLSDRFLQTFYQPLEKSHQPLRVTIDHFGERWRRRRCVSTLSPLGLYCLSQCSGRPHQYAVSVYELLISIKVSMRLLSVLFLSLYTLSIWQHYKPSKKCMLGLSGTKIKLANLLLVLIVLNFLIENLFFLKGRALYCYRGLKGH